MIACKYNQLSLARFLIKKGVDIELFDGNGMNALLNALK
jgi:hypothetical protein